MCALGFSRKVDFLIIDNLLSQAQTIERQFKNFRIAGRPVACVCHIVHLDRTTTEAEGLPKKLVRDALKEVRRHSPTMVLVDISLGEMPVDVGDESGDTWTGPALMAAIRDAGPKQKLGSYSAYTQYEDTDIRKQREKYGVADTPHFDSGAIDNQVRILWRKNRARR